MQINAGCTVAILPIGSVFSYAEHTVDDKLNDPEIMPKVHVIMN